jgi:hypothetical protein
MNSIRTAAVALAVGVGFTFSAGVSAASPADTQGSEPGVQCTRQYVVTSQTTLRDSPGGAVILNAWVSDKFNVPNASGVWYEGNLYDQYNNYFGHGYLLASALSYTGICF